jgi:DHA3 family macrolide efflux protein-like MFS transporter
MGAIHRPSLCTEHSPPVRVSGKGACTVEDVTTNHGNWKTAFFAIWSGQAFSLIGSRIAQFGLVWWLTETTGSARVLATATMIALIPGILLGPITGVLVDRWKRRLVMIAAEALIALAALWLAVMFWRSQVQIWHI